MLALSTLKSNRTRAKNSLSQEEQEANELLQQEWDSSSETTNCEVFLNGWKSNTKFGNKTV